MLVSSRMTDVLNLSHFYSFVFIHECLEDYSVLEAIVVVAQ